MEKNDIKRLIKLEDKINRIVTDMGFDFIPIEWDIVPEEKMWEILAYRGPTQISNWKFGRNYERQRTIFENVSNHLPYECVIFGDPCRAYLMKSNPFAIQALVMAHVVGHSAFFKTNKLFNKARIDMGTMLSEANHRVAEYEKLYGIDDVERTIDAGHSIQMHSSPFESETEDEKRIRVYNQLKEQHKPHKSEFSDMINGNANEKTDVEHYNRQLWRQVKMMTPVEPTEDLLRYIIDNSSVLEDWQKDILEVLRYEGQYYWPIIRTKFMNEGFACITGNSLVHTENGFVPIYQAIEFCSKTIDLNKNLTDIETRMILPKKETLKISTNIGTILEGALDHRIMTPTGDVMLKDLSIGDTISTTIGTDIWPSDKIKIDVDTCYEHLKFSKSIDVTIPSEINEDIAYLMGVITSEGHYLGRGFGITNNDTDLLSTCINIIKKYFNKDIKMIERERGGTFDITVHSTAIMDFLSQAGMFKEKSNLKNIPWSILQSPKSVVSSFIAGLFDGDGCVYYNGKYQRQLIMTSKSSSLIEQYIILLLNYGIIGSFRKNKKEGYDDCYQHCISSSKCIKIFEENIPLKSTKKQTMIKECLNNVKWSYDIPSTATITSIEKGSDVLYDWSIPNGNHYEAQGFINHNCMIHEKVLSQLFHEGDLTPDEHGQYNHSNALVKAQSRLSMNPYLVGSKIWTSIEDRWNKGQYGAKWSECSLVKEKENWDTKEMAGLDKIKDVLPTYTDWMFFQDFLTNDMIDDLDLYIYVLSKNMDGSTDYVRTDHPIDQVRQIIINSFANNGIPKIEVVDGNFGDGAGHLLLNHRYSGAPLDRQYTEETLKHISYLWGRNVYLKTIIKDKETIFKISKQ